MGVGIRIHECITETATHIRKIQYSYRQYKTMVKKKIFAESDSRIE